MVGIIASFFALNGDTFVVAVISLLALLAVAFFVKLNLINIYLKRGKYPFEFLSVLEKLKLTEDLQINWGEDFINGPDKSKMLTQQFLADNNLATDIGTKKINLPITLIFVFASVIGLIYFNRLFSFKDRPLLFVSSIVVVIGSIYVLIKNKKRQNDNAPILSFTEKGLLLNGSTYKWDRIKDWTFEEKNREGQVSITYFNESENDSDNKIIADLNGLNIGHIDFLLLLTHFKAKYG